ncbi:MAG: NAD+ synthase, partial [Bdellovibrionales bacterium]
MRIALAQVNSWLGDFSLNREKILQATKTAAAQGCELVLFPEASLFGYHPCDLLERKTVVQAQLEELKKLQQQIPKGIALLVGAIGLNPRPEGKAFTNAAVFLERGKKSQWFAKQLLPTYDVFDESRHIQPGQVKDNVLRWKGRKILVTICEDIWAWPRPGAMRSASYSKNPLKEVKRPVDLVLNMSASPFTQTKMSQRLRVVKATAAHFNAPMVYVNMVGGQDELIFDGASFAIDAKGKVLAQCGRFCEDLKVLDLNFKSFKKKPSNANEKSGFLLKAQLPQESIEVLRQSIILGMKDFALKNGFRKFHLGLSGGIDSAVVACLAVDVVGADRVQAFALPGPFSAPQSLSLAQKLADNLKIELKSISIDPLYQLATRTLDQHLGATAFGVMHENMQARLRSLLLMAVANRDNSLLLATSNKSELATGYSTLYGDMCGGLMPIGDLLKKEVYELAEFYNRQREIIPRALIDRPPTAELRPNQRDDDTLPPYVTLDPIVHDLVEGYQPAKSK